MVSILLEKIESDRIQKAAQNMTIDLGTERDCVEWLTRSQIIDDWDVRDEPEHLRTIQNFILQNSDRAARLLGIYQKILEAKTGFSPTGTVFAMSCPLVVKDTITCKDYGEAPEGYRAYLGVPLRISTGEIIGTICSFNRNPRNFEEEEVKLISIFADRAASAVENYQLYQQLQAMNETLRSQLQKRDRNIFSKLFHGLSSYLRYLRGIDR